MTSGSITDAAWIFDADGHVMEPAEMWSELPAQFEPYIPRRVQYSNGTRLVVHTRMGSLSRSFGPMLSSALEDGASGPTAASARAASRPGGSDPAARLPDMDLEFIERAALFPTIGLYAHAVSEREPQWALCRVINDWLGNYCAYRPERMMGVAMLPGNPEDALTEARRCVEQLGFRAVWRRPEMCAGLPALHAPEYEDLWSYLADANVPFFVHPGYNGAVPQEYFTDRFPDNYIAGHAPYFPVEQMMTLTSFICYGILERHPGLKIGFVETGGVWALYFLHRLDEHLEHFSTSCQLFPLQHDASYYFRRQCLVTVEDAEPGLATLVELYPENVAFSSDYPHSNGTFPGSTTSLLETATLTESQRRAVLRDNAVQFFGS